MESASRLDDLLRALSRSESELAMRILECARVEALAISSDTVVTFDSLAPTLRRRADLKCIQVERAVSSSSRRRYETMRAAIAGVLAWWEDHPDVPLRYTILTAPPDVSFVLWRRDDDGEIVGGFESRSANRLTYARGKEFFGDDWEPNPDPGVLR